MKLKQCTMQSLPTQVTTVAGSAGCGAADGPAVGASFSSWLGLITLDPVGQKLFVPDRERGVAGWRGMGG